MCKVAKRQTSRQTDRQTYNDNYIIIVLGGGNDIFIDYHNQRSYRLELTTFRLLLTNSVARSLCGS